MAKKLLTLDISSLTLDPNNSRKHAEADIQAIAASLSRFGQQTPLVVTSDNIVIKGNGTMMAAASLGWNKIEAVRTDLTGEQVAAYSIADNQTGLLSSWDNDVLLGLLQGFDDKSLVDACGFDEQALKAIFSGVEETPIKPLTVKQPPAMTWILLGISTVDLPDIAADIDRLSKVTKFCEITANDG